MTTTIVTFVANFSQSALSTFLLGAIHVFARVVNSPRQLFSEGHGEGKGDNPHETKRPVVLITIYS